MIYQYFIFANGAYFYTANCPSDEWFFEWLKERYPANHDRMNVYTNNPNSTYQIVENMAEAEAVYFELISKP